MTTIEESLNSLKVAKQTNILYMFLYAYIYGDIS